MKVTESSESVLAGTKRPPFRLVVRAVSASGMRLPVRPAVSEEFVVRGPAGHRLSLASTLLQLHVVCAAEYQRAKAEHAHLRPALNTGSCFATARDSCIMPLHSCCTAFQWVHKVSGMRCPAHG